MADKKPYCPRCRMRRTSKPMCASCQKWENRKQRALAKHAQTPGTPRNLGAAAFLESIPTPAGMTRRAFDYAQEDSYFNRGDNPAPEPSVEFAGDGITIRVTIDQIDNEYMAGSGHTSFSTSRGQFTHDRHGVSDSFYVEHEDTGATIAATIAKEIASVAETRARHDNSVTVPGLPGSWLVTPERRESIRQSLADGKGYAFTPAGFGTGYHISTRRQHPYSKALPAETAEFFGVAGQLWADPLDCD